MNRFARDAIVTREIDHDPPHDVSYVLNVIMRQIYLVIQVTHVTCRVYKQYIESFNNYRLIF